MAEYIERRKLKQGIAEDALISLSCWDSDLMDFLMLEIDECPAADVAPVVHGEWEGYTNSQWIGCDEDGNAKYRDGVLYYCSNCRRRSIIKTKFCPACGARMGENTDV